jgi:uncharacterized RDD family membrane protein YckC
MTPEEALRRLEASELLAPDSPRLRQRRSPPRRHPYHRPRTILKSSRSRVSSLAMESPHNRQDADAPNVVQPPAPNPYQPPTAIEYGQEEAADLPYPASLGRRFGNYVIDLILVVVVAAAMGGAMAVIDIELLERSGLLLQVAAYAVVYVLPEAAFGRTFGKLCTGTKVIDLRGGKPSFGQVIGRTAIRFVPFDPFSFVWGDASGWHDTWSKTRVVPVREPYADI